MPTILAASSVRSLLHFSPVVPPAFIISLTACFIDSGGCPNAVKTLATFGLSNVANAFVKDSVPPFSLTAFIKPSLELP